MNWPRWTEQALLLFSASRKPFPRESNELDWKSNLSEKNDRLVEHLIAFANYPGGGCLVYGVADQNACLIGIKENEVSPIIDKLTNLGRDAINPPLSLDHAVIEVESVPLLFVHIPEQRNMPVHRRGKSIEEAWIPSEAKQPKLYRITLRN